MANVDSPDDQLMSVIYGDYEPDDWASKHQISLSELGARLNTKQHYDNRGRQIWCDGIEEAVLQWNPGNMAGGAVARVTTAAWRGRASLQLSTVALVNSGAWIGKTFYNLLTGRYGVEVSWSSSANTFTYFILWLDVYDGTNYRRYGTVIDGVNRLYCYVNSVNAYIPLGQRPCQINDRHAWHKMKMVVDINTVEYVRILLDGIEHNMAGIPPQTIVSGICPRIIVNMELWGTGGAIENIYIDDFILTHLEP